MKTSGIVLALTLAACGKGAGDTASAQTAALRLLGVGASGHVLVRLDTTDLVADGRALATQLNGGELDLGGGQNDVTTFGLPTDAQKVTVNLQFQPLGTVVLDGKTQALDLSGPPLSVVAEAAQIRTSGQVVLQIDLARSLVTQGDQVFLLPDFIVSY